MSDFPADQLPLFVSTYSSYGPPFKGGQGNVSVGSITWVADQAVYMPVTIPWEYPVNRVFWVNGTTITTSNADFGIYTLGGGKIYSTGSTALSGTSAPQYTTPSVPFVLPAGRYYFAYVCSGTTNRAYGTIPSLSGFGSMCGMLSQSSALPLPSTATFATYANPGIELCGITRTQSGY